MKTTKRYETVSYKNIKGIRKDLKSGSFYVEKYIRGERYNATFMKIEEAADWKKNFHPSLSLKSLECSKAKKIAKEKVKTIEAKRKLNHIKKINGNDLGYTFSDVWELYKNLHLIKLEKSSIDKKYSNLTFYQELMNVKMIDFDADLISTHLVVKKELAIKNPKSRRFNFNNDLKNLKAILNWYRENYDEYFSVPILKRHQDEGFIKKKPKTKKKLKRHELISFFEALESDDIFWRDVAESQFYFASRIQEVAGLLLEFVDLADPFEQLVEIEYVMIWGANKRFSHLKDSPKNGEERIVVPNARLAEILKRRIADRPKAPVGKCPETGKSLDLVFHIDGKPLSYREIQYRYNKALKKAGLSHNYSSTHIMRHSMANMVRSEVGLDEAQVVGGWKTRELVENVYTDAPAHLARGAREKIEDFLMAANDGRIKSGVPNSPVQGRFGKLNLVKK